MKTLADSSRNCISATATISQGLNKARYKSFPNQIVLVIYDEKAAGELEFR